MNPENTDRPLRVMKFGGTSVADASCIRRVVQIIGEASQASHVTVVVSAMAGVTDKLIDAAALSESGKWTEAVTLLQDLRKKHEDVMYALIRSAEKREQLESKINELFEEAHRLCQGTVLLAELTPRVRDSISSLGERLSAPLIAATLSECDVPCEAIDATELLVVDAYQGGAEPRMDATRERCELRLRPILLRGAIPVVTGFIAATREGVLTTLGRGGSDYSATIIGASLHADEIVIWTDVDGLFTADPHLVSGASTISEISYREAAELAYFGAKVLHPKTLGALVGCGIPVWIRNTFRSQGKGTKITRTGPSVGGGARACTATPNAAVITIGSSCFAGAREVLSRALTATSLVHADVLMISPSSVLNDVCLVVPSSQAKSTVEALRREFAKELERQNAERVIFDSPVALITVVGPNMNRVPAAVGRLLGALDREDINVIAFTQGFSDCKISFVVEQKHLTRALVTSHLEFQLCQSDSRSLPIGPTDRPLLGSCESLQTSAHAD
jgi:aspartokinase/homoserine dehydrogenase 1